MSARDREAFYLQRCIDVSVGKDAHANDAAEANVFSLAASALRSSMPIESRKLDKAASEYLDSHKGEVVDVTGAVMNGWIISLPRLRDMLTMKLGAEQSHE